MKLKASSLQLVFENRLLILQAYQAKPPDVFSACPFEDSVRDVASGGQRPKYFFVPGIKSARPASVSGKR